MIAEGKLVGFVATTNAERARKFYEGVLGLEVTSDDPFALVLDSNGTMIRVTKVKDAVIAPYTVLGWNVADVQREVRALKERGVTFETYGFLEQDADAIWTAPGGAKIAWFKDPDGNVLSLSQHP
jgi:catechol 2,3-dioxygenase-like lactoylglutathione lyase family enzyme